MAISMVQDEGTNGFNAGTVIKVIGVGGGGGNAVAHMCNSGMAGIDFIFANTDSQDLSKREDCQRIQLGQTGQGAGSKPAVGRQLTQEAEEPIREAIAGANMLFITAGMGGGTGTGGAPVIARVAREMGVLTVAIVTKPFDFEGGLRTRHADEGLQELEANVDALIVVQNDKLLEVYGDDITMEAAFEHADDILKNAVRGISDIINVKGHMNVDFADVRTVMNYPGKALMGIGSAEGADRAKAAVQEAIACPLLEGVDLKQLKGALIVISASRLKLSETRIISEAVQALAMPDAVIKVGTVNDESLGDKLSVTVVATGLGGAEAQREAAPISVIHTNVNTGTDGAYALPTLTAMSTAPSAALAGQGGGALAGFQPNPVPAVFRNPRSGAGTAFATGGPASADSKVNALYSSGMTDSEIPAYLRKQAD